MGCIPTKLKTLEKRRNSIQRNIIDGKNI